MSKLCDFLAEQFVRDLSQYSRAIASLGVSVDSAPMSHVANGCESLVQNTRRTLATNGRDKPDAA